MSRGGARSLVTFALGAVACAEIHQQGATLAQVRSDLMAMMAEDQRYRDMDSITRMPPDQKQAFIREGYQADLRHTARLKQIVATHGWPIRGRFGEDASRAAFLLLQHADADPLFQERMLPELEAAATRGEIAAAEVAYLTDRVRVKQGRPQVYGTQYEVETEGSGAAIVDASGNLIYLLPLVEDIERLDERRLAAGLGPWIEYERRMAESQGRIPANRSRSASAP